MAARFYDFVVWSQKKQIEKLRYMHRNPVKRGLGVGAGAVEGEEFPILCLQRTGTVLVNEHMPAKLKVRKLEATG